MVRKAAVLSLFLLLFSSISFSVGTSEIVEQEPLKTWCVAKPADNKETLEANLEYACSQIDCKVLEKSCPSFAASPDNLINHASLAMNLYYQCKGRNKWNCDFKGSALVTVTDPSCGDCIYANEEIK